VRELVTGVRRHRAGTVDANASGRRRHEGAPVAAFVRRVNAEELILVTSGGSDWLAGFGRAERVVND